MRVGFAIVAMTVVQLNPSRAERFPVLSQISLVTFLLYSIAVLYLARKENSHYKKIGLATTYLDLAWVSVIVFSTGASQTPFFVYYFFPVITASSRYGIKGGLSAATIGVFCYGYIRLGFSWANPLNIDIFIVRSVYLFVLAYIFGFLSEFETRQNEKLVALSKTAAAVATLEERRRIMQELHDGLLQSLATCILHLEASRKQFLDSPKELDQELQSVEKDIRVSMKEIRQFLAGEETRPFPPGMLLDKLRGDLRFLSDGLGLKVVLDADDLTLQESIERDAYFVLREALSNAMRHAHASHLKITLRQNDAQLEVAIVDDGVGFDPGQVNNSFGLGLKGMRSRLEKIGGELFVESSPGNGASITFVAPLATSSNAA